MTLPSIHDNIPPLEVGGVYARDGFVFQDHVAVRFLLEMITNRSIQEVRCESQDDITLIWKNNGFNEVEFIQVKGNKLDQLWSIARLCQKEKRKNAIGESIYEKLLSNDRFSEQSRFRIVTRRDVNKDLQLLTRPLNFPQRRTSSQDFKELCEAIDKYANGLLSKKNNSTSFWVSNTIWEVEYSKRVLITKNISALREFIEQQTSEYIQKEQVEDIYEKLVQKAQDAACSDWETNPESKKIKRGDILSWLKQAIVKTQTASLTGVGKKMQEKMEAASLPPDYILTAHRERSFYRKEALTPKYLDITEREYLELEILSALLHLRTELDTGELNNSGIEFHKLCLSRIFEIQKASSSKIPPSLGMMHGYMYYITGRCWHRFLKAET